MSIPFCPFCARDSWFWNFVSAIMYRRCMSCGYRVGIPDDEVMT